jgi:hypothetical protein
LHRQSGASRTLQNLGLRQAETDRSLAFADAVFFKKTFDLFQSGPARKKHEENRPGELVACS